MPFRIMTEISSAGNTYATTGGQFIMPMTIIGAGTPPLLSNTPSNYHPSHTLFYSDTPMNAPSNIPFLTCPL